MREASGSHVFDTVVLSNFALVGGLEILLGRYGGRACITPEVLDEITDGVVAGYDGLRCVEEAVSSGRLPCNPCAPTGAERAVYRALLRVLAPGEASCIAHAAGHGGVVVTDDRTARACCSEHGVVCTGTIGILKAMCRDGTLSADRADALLHQMIDAGFYSPVLRISDLL